ncbi:hypothetical protein NIES4074_45700 [Cylindrospermum sp. NIES-4074]|nr:hypothetical protein NIES4074_45700 [Cylindrospermum sp. NIES-4074]
MSRQDAKLFLALQKGGTLLVNATLHTNILNAEFTKFGDGIATSSASSLNWWISKFVVRTKVLIILSTSVLTTNSQN